MILHLLRLRILPVAGLIALVGCGDSGDPAPTQPDPDPPTPPGPNRTPTASFVSSGDEGVAPVTITFDASGSTDPDGEIASFQWSFGDGTTATGETTSHVFADGGRFVVALTVVDDRGGRDSTSAEVFVSSPVGSGPNTAAGVVWFDRDGDGVQDAEEPGLSRFVVFLDEDEDGERDPAEPLAFTDRDGVWEFGGLEDRPYTVTQEMPFGWTNTMPGPGPAPGSSDPQRIVGGELAEIEDYPFQVALLSGDFQFCGGTLVNSQWVLTAAHCVEGAIGGQFDILIGTANLTQGGERVEVQAVRSHPEYANALDYDVAMLRLERPLLYPRSFLQTPDRPELSEPGLTATAIGWGQLEDGSGPDDLRTVEVPIISSVECADISGPGVIGPRSLCAGGPELGRGVCFGDSGGPLMTTFEFGWVQVGITSFLAERNRCGNEPAVYARVSELLDFIIGTAGIETSGSVVLDWAEGPVALVRFGNFH
jgi:trypsin